MESGYVSWLWVCAHWLSMREFYTSVPSIFASANIQFKKQVCKIKVAKLKHIIVESQPGPFIVVARLDIKRKTPYLGRTREFLEKFTPTL